MKDFEILKSFIGAMEDVQKQDLDNKQFKLLLSDSLNILNITNDEAAQIFKTPLPTIYRWLSGESAPHPFTRAPVFGQFQKIAEERLEQRIQEDSYQSFVRGED